MQTRKTKKFLLLSLFCVPLLGGCFPVAVGAGATAGVASAQEGGIKGALSDAGIKAKIVDAWFKYDLDTFSKLSSTVDQGRVLLTGVVQKPESRVEAVRLVWQIPGVKQVINEIRVADSEGLPGFVRDNWISTRLRTALTLDRDVQSLNYSIDTVQGVVYLMGVAMSQAELARVTGIARTIPNVRQVVSYIKLAGEGIPDASFVGSPDSPSGAAVGIGASTSVPIRPESVSAEPLAPPQNSAYPAQ